jgi:hypothetical protein
MTRACNNEVEAISRRCWLWAALSHLIGELHGSSSDFQLCQQDRCGG